MRDDIGKLLENGEKHFTAGRFDEARQCFTAVLQVEYNNVDALNNLGVLACHLELYNEAAAFLKRALEIDPENQDALVNFGKCWAEMGNFERAIDMLEKSVRMVAPTPDVLSTLAACYYQQRELEAAESWCRKSLAADPGQKATEDLLAKIAAERQHFSNAADHYTSGALRIGFVSIWFERGQAYVTRALMQALSGRHEIYLFARTGGVHGEAKLETAGDWQVPNMTTFGDYRIPGFVFEAWVRENRLDAVIFNEEYDWSLIEACQRLGVMALTYLDYYKADWEEKIGGYDGVLCSTRRTYELLKPHCQAYFIGWGIDTKKFRPRQEGEKFTFFHNAGWLGINYRKMTPAAILAFEAISQALPEVTLFVHAQCGLDKLPLQIGEIVRRNPRIEYFAGTVPAPGLYHRGSVLLFPTKLEGLGLPLLEGLACGLPAIATDAPPMNEFVRDGENGLLVKVAKSWVRDDGIAFPETIVDVNDLAEKMYRLAVDIELRDCLAAIARQRAEEELDFKAFASRVLDAVEHVAYRWARRRTRAERTGP